MFELKISDNDVTGGSIAVSWSIDPQLIKELADKNVADPQVVICVTPVYNYRNQREYRKVVPLSDLMTYIEFRVPGPNKIWAFVSLLEKREARDQMMKRADGKFTTDILNWYGDQYSTYDYQKFGSSPLEVTVPANVFAAEPAQWEKDWVNHLFREKPIDQCHFRKRRLFAYTIQPLIMFFNMLIRVILYIPALLIGARNLTPKYLLHPLTYTLGETQDVVKGGSYFIRTWEGDPGIMDAEDEGWKYWLRKLWTLPLMPVISIPIFCVFYFHQYKGAGILLGIALLVILMLGIIGFVSEGYLRKSYYAFCDWLMYRLGHRDMWYLDQAEMEALYGKNYRKIGDLPSNKRSLKLRFSNLKSKVCRPFSA